MTGLEFMMIEMRGDSLRVVTVTMCQGAKNRPVADRTMWTLGKMRMAATCAICERGLPKGTSTWRPVTNKLYRRARVCLKCFRYAPEAAS